MPRTATAQRFWEEGPGPQTAEEFALLSAMTIAMSARNAVEDLHVAGAFSDSEAPVGCLQTIEEPESAAQIGYLARMIPSYWELPTIRSSLRPFLRPQSG